MIAAFLAFIVRVFGGSAPPPVPPKAAVAPPPWPPLTSHDRDILTRTLYGEAANESEAGQIAVIHVMRNRLLRGPASRFGGTPAEVCQKPWQFSCWNANDPMRVRLLALRPDSDAYKALGAVVDKAWSIPDTVGGADHYAANYIARPAWAMPPAKLVKQIGVHQFYAGVR